MTIDCPICGKSSKDAQGVDIWPRELGFFEIQINSGVWGVCSRECAIKLVKQRGSDRRFVGDSRQWHCQECGDSLPFSPSKGTHEFVPFGVPQLSLPGEFGEYHCFCSTDCLLKKLHNLDSVSIST